MAFGGIGNEKNLVAYYIAITAVVFVLFTLDK